MKHDTRNVALVVVGLCSLYVSAGYVYAQKLDENIPSVPANLSATAETTPQELIDRDENASLPEGADTVHVLIATTSTVVSPQDTEIIPIVTEVSENVVVPPPQTVPPKVAVPAPIVPSLPAPQVASPSTTQTKSETTTKKKSTKSSRKSRAS